VGIDLKLKEKYVSYFIGPAILTETDTILGSNFQVFHKLSIGYRDDQDKRIGLFIKHFSDAGISNANYGRNFVGLEISF
jgi:pectin methylesterase-like acyl-CoA thioesterase